MSDKNTGQVYQVEPNRYVIEVEASCDGQSVRTRYEAPTAEEVVRLQRLAESGEPIVAEAQPPISRGQLVVLPNGFMIRSAICEVPWGNNYALWKAARHNQTSPAEDEVDNPVIVEAEKERQ